MKKILSFFAAMLVAVAANAATINIDPSTDNAIQGALNSAASGDEIVLAAGTYNESGNYLAFTGKELTVRAAEGAEVIIKTVCPVRLKEGAKAEFVNVKFDCSTIGSYEYVIVAADDTENKRVVLKGCEFYGWEKNKAMIEATSERRLASVTIDGCYFHNCMKSVVFIENTGSIDLSIKNSTFANISTNTESFWAGVIDSRATAGSVLVDHCTFYNVNAMNTDYAAIGKIKTPGAVVSNSIFVMPTATDGVRAIRDVAEAKNCITFNYSYDSGKGIHSDVTKTNCIQEDPKFVNAAEGNFNLGEGSPALTLNDGQPIGDPRWVPSVAPVEPLMKTIYCKMDKDWWKADGAAVGCYTWKDGGQCKVAWPGERMTPVEGETDVWSIELDINTYHMCIFTRVNGEGDVSDWGAKTTDLTIPTDENDMFTITNDDPTWGDPGCTGAWSKFEASAPVEKKVIYDWAGEVGTTILGASSVEISTVKIHTNTDEIPAIKFSSSYVYADGKWLAIKPAEGGFKAGDVLSVAAVFNNSNDTKYAQIDLRAANGDTRIWLSDSASTINGRTNAGAPIVQTYTLEADQDSLFLGRYGNTNLFVTMLKVERAAGVTPEPVLPSIALIGEMNSWDGSQGAFVVADDKLSASLTLNLAEMPQANGYAFKLLVDGIAMGSERVEGNPFTFTRENNILSPVDHVAVGDDEIFWLFMDVTGDYTFTYTFADNSLAITYPALAPVEHSYTVAGSSAVAFGTAWDPTNTANDMAKQDDGSYKWEKANLELPAGTIEFKVCQDHDWATCWPAQNYALNVSEAATYTLTITFNPANENVGAELTKTGSAEIDPAASAKGSWDGWAAEVVFVLADNKETASGALNLEPGDYEFKVILNGGDWRSNGYSYHREFTGAEGITGNGDNMVLKADVAGEYTLTWTFATNALNITFPVASGIDNTNVAVKAQKMIINGQLFIIRNGEKFNVQGQVIR